MNILTVQSRMSEINGQEFTCKLAGKITGCFDARGSLEQG